MIQLEINTTCIECDNCRLICPENAVVVNEEGYCIDQFSCTLCSLCIVICPENSIEFVG